jgi:hypothetical protein
MITGEDPLAARRARALVVPDSAPQPTGSDILNATDLLNPNQNSASDPYLAQPPMDSSAGQSVGSLLQGEGNQGTDGRWQSFPIELPPGSEYEFGFDAESQLKELVSGILDPIRLGDGAIGFSLGGLGDFIVEKSPDNGTLHIFETETQLHVSLPTGEGGLSPASESDAGGSKSQKRRTGPARIRELAARLRDFLFSAPRMVLITLLVGGWLAWRTARHIARRNENHRDQLT